MEAPLFDEEEYRRWRDEADGALAAARTAAGAGLHNWACFLAEQAAQLGAKALLHGLGQAPWGHDLPRLLDDAARAGLLVREEIRDAGRRLSRHYIPARYPDAHPAGTSASHYGRADADEALADTRRVLTFVDREWERLHA